MAAQLELPVHGGFRMRVDTAQPMGRVLAASGVWEPHVTSVFRELLHPGDVCVDVGAHAGYFTLLAAKRVGPKGRVFAIEPSPGTYAALRGNLKLNNMSNVTALPVAAGAHASSVRVSDEADSLSVSVQVADDGDIEVQTVAELVRQSERERLRLVKIDVEGHEHDVLEGVLPLYADGFRPALVVELHSGRGDAAIPLLVALLENYGLRGFELIPDGRRELWRAGGVGPSGMHVLVMPT
jgi:FkbM family methyltransferase